MASAFDHGQALVMMMVTQVSICLNELALTKVKIFAISNETARILYEVDFFEDQ